MNLGVVLIFAICLTIGLAIMGILHYFASEIARAHEIKQLTRDVKIRRARYLAAIRGKDKIIEVSGIDENESEELGEVEIMGDTAPSAAKAA